MKCLPIPKVVLSEFHHFNFLRKGTHTVNNMIKHTEDEKKYGFL